MIDCWTYCKTLQKLYQRNQKKNQTLKGLDQIITVKIKDVEKGCIKRQRMMNSDAR